MLADAAIARLGLLLANVILFWWQVSMHLIKALKAKATCVPCYRSSIVQKGLLRFLNRLRSTQWLLGGLLNSLKPLLCYV